MAPLPPCRMLCMWRSSCDRLSLGGVGSKLAGRLTDSLRGSSRVMLTISLAICALSMSGLVLGLPGAPCCWWCMPLEGATMPWSTAAAAGGAAGGGGNSCGAAAATTRPAGTVPLLAVAAAAGALRPGMASGCAADGTCCIMWPGIEAPPGAAGPGPGAPAAGAASAAAGGGAGGPRGSLPAPGCRLSPRLRPPSALPRMPPGSPSLLPREALLLLGPSLPVASMAAAAAAAAVAASCSAMAGSSLGKSLATRPPLPRPLAPRPPPAAAAAPSPPAAAAAGAGAEKASPSAGQPSEAPPLAPRPPLPRPPRVPLPAKVDVTAASAAILAAAAPCWPLPRAGRCVAAASLAAATSASRLAFISSSSLSSTAP
jgi:hypothetical protein